MTKTMAEAVAVFARGGQRFALPVAVVERIVRAVALEAWAEEQEGRKGVVGAVNVHGERLPVFDFRCWADGGVPTVPGEGEYLILVRTARQRAAIVSTEMPEVGRVEVAAVEGEPPADALPGTRPRGEGLVFIHDLDRLLCHAGRIQACAPVEGDGGGDES